MASSDPSHDGQEPLVEDHGYPLISFRRGDDGLPHYRRPRDVETACGCLVIAGAVSIAFWALVLWLWGPLAVLGIVLIEVAAFGWLVRRGGAA